ncbi:protein EE16 [Elephantid betaherpesvirus 1]|uniref:Protein EE16 n=1 Tax=Elephantid herpesvirus 1 TaxID=146015 RepID=M4JZA4_ELHV1|nr:protein EE16 [Elephantid betaherpesvirus 1]AGE10014.2 protein EE16 [Elephantid betaherpesvirus 1]
MDVHKHVFVSCILLVAYTYFSKYVYSSNFSSPANQTICQKWQAIVLNGLEEIASRRRKRDTGDCLENFGNIIATGLGGSYAASGRKKRSEESPDYKCISKSIMKCLFYIDNEHFFSNDTHIFGNVTVNTTYIHTNLSSNSSLQFNISNMVVPLLHADNLNHTYFKDRNNTWPWCMPDIPGKKLNIIWRDTLIPPAWLVNATSISVGAFGFEFIDGANVIQFVSDK